MTSPPPQDPWQQGQQGQWSPQYPPQYPPPQYPPPQYPPQYQPPGYPYAYNVTKAPISSAGRAFGWVYLVLAVLLVLAPFLPWRSIDGHSWNGYANVHGEDGDGYAVVALALAPFVLGLLRGLGKAALGAAIVTLVLGAMVALGMLGAMDDIDHDEFDVGAGPWVALVIGVVMVATGIVGIVKRR